MPIESNPDPKNVTSFSEEASGQTSKNGSKDMFVIREIYDSENAHEAFVEELENALETGYSFIVIEPSRLGDETARWIAVGNCLHKTAIITGLGAIAAGLAWSPYPFMYAPLCITSLFCTGVYTVSWQFDPCVKYQVYTNTQQFYKRCLPKSIVSLSPVILIRKNDNRRKILHCCVTLASAIFCSWKLYKIFNN